VSGIRVSKIEDAAWLASQRVLAPGAAAAIQDCVRRWIADHPGRGPYLDVGCGPRSRLAEAGVEAIGIDLHPGWGITASATQLPFAAGAFESVWSFGLLHHLPDPAAQRALAEMLRVTKPRGYVVVFDGVLPEDWRPLAWLVRRLDRGSGFRSLRDHLDLLALYGTWQCERITYARTGLESVLAWTRTEGDPAC
jgi:SAM-dependent methyltransferase